MFTRYEQDIFINFASEIGCIEIEIQLVCRVLLVTLYFETGRNYREMKIEISVKSLLLVCPILERPMKFSMTKGFSTNPRYQEFRHSLS